MSRLIPEEEYNQKRLTKVLKWIAGEADPLSGNVEVRENGPQAPNERLIRKHRMDQEVAIRLAQDEKRSRVYRVFRQGYKAASVICCLALVAILLLSVSYLPPAGSPDNPNINEVTEKYIVDGLEDTGAVNIVTGMILDYRAFDTFGESNVLFIATCTVLILLRKSKKEDAQNEDGDDSTELVYEPEGDCILQKITFLLFPIIMIFGIYVVLNGHISPGGGFSGGAIMGAGLILYANAFGFEKLNRFFTEKTYKWVSFSALTFYCLAKSYSFFTGANHLESGIPLGTPGAIISSGLILPLNICVGLVVACTMYAFYTLFRKGGF